MYKFQPGYHCHNTQKYFRPTQQNKDINKNKFWKMCTIVEFPVLVLDSLKYMSKAEPPINRSAKGVHSRNHTTSRHNHSLIFLFIYYLFLLFTLFFIYLHKAGITILSL